MLGSVSDIVRRMHAVLPRRWFADQAPRLNAVLGAIATPLSWVYSLLQYVTCQTRLSTATDDWLDLIAYDFLGLQFNRKPGEGDAVYRFRIQNALLQESATRKALASALTQMTGGIPAIFEPANCGDTGAYSTFSGGTVQPFGLAYGSAGGWGSLTMPFQFFVTVSRHSAPEIAMIGGYNTFGGGYSGAALSYINPNTLPGRLTDEDIRSALTKLLPINAVAWLRII